jgi:hypothetical protein
MTEHNPHQSAFIRWREANKQGGSLIGEAILAYLENEPPVHPLDENYTPISTVPMPMPAPSNITRKE